MATDDPQRNGEWEPDEDAPPPSPPWSVLAQAIAAVLWPSFLAASIATMLFFAFVDPALLGHTATPAVDISRMTGYGIGFFFFWLITTISSAASVYLVCTARGQQDKQGQDGPS
jgi:hypothetical protein